MFGMVLTCFSKINVFIGQLTSQVFHKHLLDVVLPKFKVNQICLATATCWMYKIGFRPHQHRKSMYHDGHKQPDVVESRNKFLVDAARLRKYSKKYDGPDCDVPLLVEPNLLESNRETVFIYHDKSTIHAKERPKTSWILPGCNEL
jgi:hypothetical protein